MWGGRCGQEAWILPIGVEVCHELAACEADFVQTAVQTDLGWCGAQVLNSFVFSELSLERFEASSGLKIRVSAVQARP